MLKWDYNQKYERRHNKTVSPTAESAVGVGARIHPALYVPGLFGFVWASPRGDV